LNPGRKGSSDKPGNEPSGDEASMRSSDRRPDLSVIIPALNESRRLGTSLRQLRDYATVTGKALEVVVVDDGSVDGTSDLVRRFDPGPLTVQLLQNPRNMGKGYSVRRGMLAAEGEALLMSDADSSTPIQEVDNLLPWLRKGCDVVIGSRRMPESVLRPAQPWFRRVMDRTFRFVRRTLMLRDIRDTQCGFKCLTRAAGRRIFERLKTRGFAFDCEMLGLARKLGYQIKEIGVLWCNDPDSRVHWVRDPFRMAFSLLRIRRRLKRLEAEELAGAEAHSET
jgi:dolichyl-phosphate beta-glucosyltransferase